MIHLLRGTMLAAGLLTLPAERASLAAQSPAGAPNRQLSLGFAVDTSVVPGTWWGVDPARAVLPASRRLPT